MEIYFILLCMCICVARGAEAEPFDWSKITPVDIGVSTSFFPRGFFAKPRIVGGQEAVPHEFPFQVGIRIDGRSFCGGSIISEFYVLTAAHCVDGARSVELILGAHNIKQAEITQKIYTSSDFIVHENWNPSTLTDDIALVRVATGMELTNEIQIIRLPAWSQVEETFKDRRANVSGWGRPSDIAIGISSVLRYVESKILGNIECRAYFSIIKDSHICLDGRQGKGSCNGDSGGPLSITESDGVRTAIGTVSFGSGWGCEWGFPTVYARITSFLSWIRDNTEGTVEIRN